MAQTAELQRFYASAAWTNLRHRLIIERGGVCERCGYIAADTSELIGHHKILLTNENYKDVSISLNPKNIEILCWKCHNQEHAAERQTKQRSVFLVTGSPLAGKSTYVREHYSPSIDLIIDLDSIYQALGYLPVHYHPEGIKAAACGCRDWLLEHVRTRAGKWSTAWVIQSLPRKTERDALQARLGADIIWVESTREDCLQRARERNAREGGDDWVKIVTKYWDDYDRYN